MIHPNKPVLVRQCDVCGKATAADMDVTIENLLAMEMTGQTVRVVKGDDFERFWASAGNCPCAKQKEDTAKLTREHVLRIKIEAASKEAK